MYKCNAYSILTKHLSCPAAITFAVLSCDSKTRANFFFLLHNFKDRRFVLTVNHSNLRVQFFSFLVKSRAYTFSLKRSTFWLLYGISESPVSLLLHFESIFK